MKRRDELRRANPDAGYGYGGTPQYGRSEHRRDEPYRYYEQEGYGESPDYGATGFRDDFGASADYGRYEGTGYHELRERYPDEYRSAWYADRYRTRGFGEGYEDRQDKRRGMRGRTGPKGYTRSDLRIEEDISERLLHSDQIDSSEVTVKVQGGNVTFEGMVPERWMRYAIEDEAADCAGVTDIDNNIRVQRHTVRQQPIGGERKTNQ